MTVKGQEFPAYDSRGIQGMGLAYATANRGACHLRGYTVACEVLGIPVKTDPLRDRRQGRAGEGVPGRHRGVRLFGGCAFSRPSPGRWQDVAPQLAGRVRGRLVTLDNLNVVGERIWNMERDFNNRAGFTTKDDNLPPRLMKSRPRPAPPRGSSTASTRCCRSTTSCAAGTPKACRAPRRASGSEPRRSAGGGEARHPRQRPRRGRCRRDAAQGRSAAMRSRWSGTSPAPPYSRMAIPYLLMGNIDEKGT